MECPGDFSQVGTKFILLWVFTLFTLICYWGTQWHFPPNWLFGNFIKSNMAPWKTWRYPPCLSSLILISVLSAWAIQQPILNHHFLFSTSDIYLFGASIFSLSEGKKKVMGIHRIYCTNYFPGSLWPPSKLLTVALYFLFIRFLSALLGSLQAFLNVSATQVHNSHWKLIIGHIWLIFKFKSHVSFFNSVKASNRGCCEPCIKTKDTNFKVIYNIHTEHCWYLILVVKVKAKKI